MLLLASLALSVTTESVALATYTVPYFRCTAYIAKAIELIAADHANNGHHSTVWVNATVSYTDADIGMVHGHKVCNASSLHLCYQTVVQTQDVI